jgi:hypothetical protein
LIVSISIVVAAATSLVVATTAPIVMVIAANYVMQHIDSLVQQVSAHIAAIRHFLFFFSLYV